jgi:crotonobetainyl-CoA:carnitine CoA-transferase CaiB-like acyl-CoA transferase
MWMAGDPDRPPARSGTSIGDVNAGSHALGAILAALYYREKTGKGQYIDISLRDCLSAILETAIPRYTMSSGQDKPHRSGPHHATIAPYGVFNAGRGSYVVLGALNQGIWGRLCTSMNCSELTEDPRYNSTTTRAQNLPDVIKMIETWLQSYEDVRQPLEILENNGVPSAPVQSIEQLMEDPQFLMRDMIVEVEDPIFGKVKLPATPMRFSETTVMNNESPPMLGGNTEEVLKSLGLSDEEIGELRSKKII